jgi:hypothetical protein
MAVIAELVAGVILGLIAFLLGKAKKIPLFYLYFT